MKSKLTETQQVLILLVCMVLVVSMSYYLFVSKRYEVKEDKYAVNPLLSPGNQMVYETEFCADKLTNLIAEIHFLEIDISTEKRIIEPDEDLMQDEVKVIEIEQNELQTVRDRFYEYRGLCNNLDKNPTTKLCKRFVSEAKHNMDKLDSDPQSSAIHDLKKISRIYDNIKKKCENVKKLSH